MIVANPLIERAKNTAGWIWSGAPYGKLTSEQEKWLFRNPDLCTFTAYMQNMQYAHLPKYDPNVSEQKFDDRKTQPKYIFPMAEIATRKLAAHLCGDNGNLMFKNDKQKETKLFLDDINFWGHLSSAIPEFMANGSFFMRYRVSKQNALMIKMYNSMECRPEFDDSGDLEKVTIRYIYDSGERKESGEKIYRYNQIVLGKMYDQQYSNPVFEQGEKFIPEMKVIDTVIHNQGFVQGEWFKTSYSDELPDGNSFVRPIMDWLDGLNYRQSKEDSSLYYNLFPLIQAYGMDSNQVKDAIETMDDAKQSSFNILTTGGRPSNEAGFSPLNMGMEGLQIAEGYHVRFLQLMQYILNEVLLDPERVAAHAQSGVAMKALHQPIMDNITLLRPWIKKSICNFLEKIEFTAYKYNVPRALPIGTFANSEKKWGLVFADTIADTAQKVASTDQAVAGRFLSRKTACKHVAPNFGVEDVEEELRQIELEQEDDMQREVESAKQQQMV